MRNGGEGLQIQAPDWPLHIFSPCPREGQQFYSFFFFKISFFLLAVLGFVAACGLFCSCGECGLLFIVVPGF